jgi:hypothetical protein
MGTIQYQDGSYLCAECDAKLRVPAGAQIRRGFTTVEAGRQERVVFADGLEIHRCTITAPGE